jgi:hypothetical protein
MIFGQKPTKVDNQPGIPLFEFDRVWSDQFRATGIGIYSSGLLTPRLANG